MKFTNEQKKKAFLLLSMEEQEFINSTDNVELIEKIALEARLDAEQANILDTEIYLTQLKLQTVDELIVNLEKEGIPEDKTVEIIQKIYKSDLGIKEGGSKPNITEKTLLDEGNEHLIMAPTSQNSEITKVKKEEPEEKPTVTLQEAVLPETLEEPLVTTLQEASSPEIEPGPLAKNPQVHVPSKSAVEAKLAELKKSGEGAVLEKKYLGSDPYREPIG